MLAAFWAAIPVEVTQEAGIFPRCRRAAIRTLFQSPNTTCRETVGLFYPCPQVVESCPTRIVGLVSIFVLVKTTFVILTYAYLSGWCVMWISLNGEGFHRLSESLTLLRESLILLKHMKCRLLQLLSETEQNCT